MQGLLVIKVIRVIKGSWKLKSENLNEGQMGSVFRKLFSSGKMAKQQSKILMLGLDGAGKTTILYSLKLGQVNNTIPTIGFNVEELHY